MNPNRECRFCQLSGRAGNLTEAKKILNQIEWKDALYDEEMMVDVGRCVDATIQSNEFKDATDECPACTLAALRQTGTAPFASFRYRKAADDLLQQINEASEAGMLRGM